jgi:hypothetical protein
MRFMTMVRFDESMPAGQPPPELFQAMGEFAAEGARNGTLVDQGGLLPTAAGAIVSLADGTIKAVDGPCTEAKELVGGYTVLEVRSKAEAVELANGSCSFTRITAWLGRELRGASTDRAVI